MNVWAKQGILLGFRLGVMEDYSTGSFSFVDKSTQTAERGRFTQAFLVAAAALCLLIIGVRRAGRSLVPAHPGERARRRRASLPLHSR